MEQQQQHMDPAMQGMLPPHDGNMNAPHPPVQYANAPHQFHPQQQPLHDNKPPQISFDESLESGYSTPNSRNRRIIREIIV